MLHNQQKGELSSPLILAGDDRMRPLAAHYKTLNSKDAKPYCSTCRRLTVRVDRRTATHQIPVAIYVIDAVYAWPEFVYFHRSEEHTSELQSRPHLVCRLLLEKKNA